MSVISALGQETVFGDVIDSERLEHRDIRLGVLGDEADGWRQILKDEGCQDVVLHFIL